MSDVASPDVPPQLVLFDGVCGLCNGFVDLLLRVDTNGALRFAPLQGETAARVRARHPELPQTLDTMVFVDAGQVFLRMKGVFRGARYLGWPWRLAYVFFFVPAWLTTPVYALVARTRYLLFGKRESDRDVDFQLRHVRRAEQLLAWPAW